MDDTYSRLCPVCGYMATAYPEQNYFATRVRCGKCGTFVLESDVFSYDDGHELSLIEKACLYYHLTNGKARSNQNLIPHFHNNPKWGEEISIGENKHKIIHINTIKSIYPDSIEDRINMTLVNLASLVEYIGNFFVTRIENSRYYHIFFVNDRYKDNESKKLQFIGLLNILIDDGYVELVGVPAGHDKKYTLTSKGWVTVAKYQEKNRVIQQGFIAMMFSDEMLSAKEKITAAIKDCGYNPMVIDQKEHNNQIVPEIFYEIRQSQFVVADLTGQRNGVYYEAGYGEALGKQIIVTCRKLHEGDLEPHFDIAQKNTIFWENEDDLYERLKRRISVTVGCLSNPV